MKNTGNHYCYYTVINPLMMDLLNMDKRKGGEGEEQSSNARKKKREAEVRQKVTDCTVGTSLIHR